MRLQLIIHNLSFCINSLRAKVEFKAFYCIAEWHNSLTTKGLAHNSFLSPYQGVKEAEHDEYNTTRRN